MAYTVIVRERGAIAVFWSMIIDYCKSDRLFYDLIMSPTNDDFFCKNFLSLKEGYAFLDPRVQLVVCHYLRLAVTNSCVALMCTFVRQKCIQKCICGTWSLGSIFSPLHGIVWCPTLKSKVRHSTFVWFSQIDELVFFDIFEIIFSTSKKIWNIYDNSNWKCFHYSWLHITKSLISLLYIISLPKEYFSIHYSVGLWNDVNCRGGRSHYGSVQFSVSYVSLITS